MGDRYVLMDLIRGTSALFVCCGHLRAVMFVDYKSLGEPSVVEQVFYFLSSLGHEAVMVFFVLSGFFVGGSIVSKRFKFGFDTYMISRLSRLWTVLFPALIFTLILDLITGLYYPEVLNGTYRSELMSGPDLDYSLSIGSFISNMAFVQAIHSPVFGSNGPLWSLANEFWYYVTFPLIMIVVGVVRKSPLVRVFSFITVMVVVYLFTWHIFNGFMIWLLGVVVFLVYIKYEIKLGYWFFLFSGFLFVASLFNCKTDFLEDILPLNSDFILGLSFSLLLISIRPFEKSRIVRQSLQKIAFWLSDISYTLYVFHFPAFILIYGIFYKDEQLELDFSSAFQFLGWLFLIIIMSRGLWSLFEKKTGSVRSIMFSMKKNISKRLRSNQVS